MFAIIKTGGKQYTVRPGQKVKIEKIETPEGGDVVFDTVLFAEDSESRIGTPYVKDYIVKGKVLKQGKGEKIISYKYNAKKRYHRKVGHRQLYTEVEIISIGAGAAEKVAKPKTATAAVLKKKVSAKAKEKST
ncbi:MAG: 50S ribosomal protein L21 [Candidatus Spechtbacteria bacterium]|nr:50S ribosomal protein L21 [Candidatus Spechtbacteria bacterium]